MNSLYLLLGRRSATRPSTQSLPALADEPLMEIRPGAFARWIAEIEAQAVRSRPATNEGIAATQPGGALEPG